MYLLQYIYIYIYLNVITCSHTYHICLNHASLCNSFKNHTFSKPMDLEHSGPTKRFVEALTPWFTFRGSKPRAPTPSHLTPNENIPMTLKNCMDDGCFKVGNGCFYTKDLKKKTKAGHTNFDKYIHAPNVESAILWVSDNTSHENDALLGINISPSQRYLWRWCSFSQGGIC